MIALPHMELVDDSWLALRLLTRLSRFPLPSRNQCSLGARKGLFPRGSKHRRRTCFLDVTKKTSTVAIRNDLVSPTIAFERQKLSEVWEIISFTSRMDSYTAKRPA